MKVITIACRRPILIISGIKSLLSDAIILETLGRNMPFKALANVYVYPSIVIAIPNTAMLAAPDIMPSIDGARLNIILWHTEITVTQPENPNISLRSLVFLYPKFIFVSVNRLTQYNFNTIIIIPANAFTDTNAYSP